MAKKKSGKGGGTPNKGPIDKTPKKGATWETSTKESELEDDESDEESSGEEFGKSGEEFGESGEGDAKGNTGGTRDNTIPLGEDVRGFGNTPLRPLAMPMRSTERIRTCFRSCSSQAGTMA